MVKIVKFDQFCKKIRPAVSPLPGVTLGDLKILHSIVQQKYPGGVVFRILYNSIDVVEVFSLCIR